ncbi:phosphatase PAP2 family protein [Eubacterium aggregans]|uniref:phosphatase PAP2 family protein n=1 Tax=Eubacterium aggregans TaxID=81409 RepID=UPI003F3096F1
MLFLQNIRFATDGVFNSFFSFVTTLGEWTFILLLMAGIYWCIDKKSGAFMGLCCGTASMINQFLKITFCVYRPWIRSADIEPIDGAKTTATGYSFPSGHSASASSAYGSLAYCYQKYRGIMWALIINVLMVMFSRNFLGVHTPQDVVVGCIVGSSIVLIMGWVFRKCGEFEKFDLILTGVILSLGILLIIYAMTKSYPVDYVDGKLLVDPMKMIKDTYAEVGIAVGAALGWLIERRCIQFEVKGAWPVRILRYLIGAALIVFW